MTQALLSFAQENTYLLQGTVTADAADGATTIAYSLDSGAESDVLPDQEVEFLRSSVITGRLRVRGSGTTSTSLHVEEFSPGRIEVLTGDTFRVIESWRIRHRLPSATEDFNPDQLSYTDEHENAAPIATSGENVIGYAEDLSAVTHTGGGRNVDIDSTQGHLSHAWSMPDSNTSASASFVADYSGLAAGTHWGSHAVTDTDNSKVTTQRKVVRVHGTGDEPYEVLEATISGTPENSSTLSVTLSDTVDIDDVADGCLGWLWLRNYGTQGTILFEGYLVRDSVRKDADSETISFEMLSARGILEALPGFSTVLETVADPANWLEAKGLTVEDAIVYRLRELTTVLNLHDLELSDISGLPFPMFYLQEQVPFAQVNELADGVDCLFTCTFGGKLRIVKPTWNMTAAERTAASTMTTLNDDNVRELDETREHRATYSLVEGRGFAGDAPIFSHSPGSAPKEGPQKTTVERKIYINQTDANDRNGRYEGRLNFVKFGLPTRKTSVGVISSLYALDPALCDQYIVLNNITTKRGLTHSNTRMSLESYNATWSADAERNPDISLDLQEETDGVAGVTYVPPNNDIGIVTDPEPDPYTETPTGVTLLTDIQNMTFANEDGYLYQTTDFDDPTAPTWTRFASGVSGSLTDAVQISTLTTRLVLVTTDVDGIYTLDDPRGAKTLTTRKTFADAAVWRSVDAPIGGNLVFCYSYYGNTAGKDGHWFCYSADQGATWSTEVQVTAHYRTSGDAQAYFWLSSANPGIAIVISFTTTANPPASAFYSINYLTGTVSSAITTPTNFSPARLGWDIHLPFHNNPNDDVVYFTRYSTTADEWQTWRRTGSTVANISPVFDGYSMRLGWRFSISTGLTNRSLVMMSGNNEVSPSRNGVFASRNYGDAGSWTKITPGNTTTYRGIAQAGDDPLFAFLWGESGSVAIAAGFDDGVIVDKSGNILTDFPTVQRHIKPFGI